MSPTVKIEDLIEVVDLDDPMFVWCLDRQSGEITLAEFEDGGQIPAYQIAIPTLTEPQLLTWVKNFARDTDDDRIRGLTESALSDLNPYSRFGEILTVNPRAEYLWNLYRSAVLRPLLLEWLEINGFESA